MNVVGSSGRLEHLVARAARISLELGTPTADSVVLARARLHEAVLWTQDADLATIEDVRYVERRSG